MSRRSHRRAPRFSCVGMTFARACLHTARRIERHPKIEVIRHVEVDAINGDRAITGLRLRHVREAASYVDCSAARLHHASRTIGCPRVWLIPWALSSPGPMPQSPTAGP